MLQATWKKFSKPIRLYGATEMILETGDKHGLLQKLLEARDKKLLSRELVVLLTAVDDIEIPMLMHWPDGINVDTISQAAINCDSEQLNFDEAILCNISRPICSQCNSSHQLLIPERDFNFRADVRNFELKNTCPTCGNKRYVEYIRELEIE